MRVKAMYALLAVVAYASAVALGAGYVSHTRVEQVQRPTIRNGDHWQQVLANFSGVPAGQPSLMPGYTCASFVQDANPQHATLGYWAVALCRKDG